MPHTPHDNNSNGPQSELDMIEHAMNSMMQGVFSTMFRSFMEPVIFETNRIQQLPENTQAGIASDDFDGSDFRRLANKSRQQRGLPEIPDNQPTQQQHDMIPAQPPSLLGMMMGEQQPTSSSGTLLDLLLPDHDRFFNRSVQAMDMFPREDEVGGPHQTSNWSFSSSSQRRVLRPDGTEESYVTSTKNGVTETIKRIKHPDGTVEETRESGTHNNGIQQSHPSLLITNQSSPIEQQQLPPSIQPRNPQQQQQQDGEGGPLFKMWKRIFG
ncbi:predicted protein [Lichtheimia corymbifera JMRC:FSU:9682]|uniref:Uncharacterized protein n=1 Tax=Lichtheimia corymbifera JMRC:FSU:9682 TaxID=1263082 RepID=A0A068RPK0_9FUNG|nr:predicted protein [Lichtheimia corymbifera JMRC:FSU:9682]